jgi:hypothetical protein
MTQLFDDVDGVGDPWDGDPWDEDRSRRPASSPRSLAPAGDLTPDAPLFEQLRVAYLRGEDTNEWARDGGTDGWAAVDDDWDDVAGETVAGRNGWTANGNGHAGRGRAGVDDEDAVDTWSPSPPQASRPATGPWVDEEYPDGWADEPGGWDPDELEEAEEPAALAAQRQRSSRRSRASGRGRVALRRTSTLLNTSTVMNTGVWLLVAAVFGLLVLGGRLLTTRQLFFMTHSALGIVIVHAFGGGIGTLITGGDSPMKDRIRKLSTAALAIVAWLASIIGTWGGYAGYRAKLPPGGDVAMYPREYLLRSPGLAFWETFAMEWKVHIGWTTPFLATAVAFVALRYRRRLVADPLVRKVMTNLLVIAFAGALVAAVMGAMVNVTAPNDFMHRGWSP